MKNNGPIPDVPHHLFKPHAPHCRADRRDLDLHSSHCTCFYRGKMYLIFHCSCLACEGLMGVPLEWAEKRLYVKRLAEVEE